MGKIVFTLFICLTFSVYIFSQESESQKLTQTSFALYQQGKFDEAISLAEQVVKFEMSSPTKNWLNISASLMNLALMKKEHYQILVTDSKRKDISEEVRKKIIEKAISYNESIPDNFQKIIEIYEKNIQVKDIRLANAKIELATFLSKFYNNSTNIRMRSHFAENIKSSKDNDIFSQIENSFLDGIQIRTKILGEDDDLTLSTILLFANFYQNYADYENSLPLYEKYITTIKGKYGAKSQFLLAGLRSVAAILYSTESESEAKDIVKNIEAITNQTETSFTDSLDLSLRNKEDELYKLVSSAPITTYLKKQKWLLVHISMDENGNVINVLAEDPKEKDMFGKDVKEKAEKSIRDWKFKPFEYQGSKRKLKGIVWFPYFVKG